MSDRSGTAEMRRFYEEYPFPGNRPPDRDGLIFLRHFAESVARARKAGATPIRVLDAGCGTGNTSLSLARTYPGIDIVGVDQSRTSLARARMSAASFSLPNLIYRNWNLADPLPRAEQYDIILSLGVLHHTADMKRVLSNLRRPLAMNGELFLWIYGRHGRYRHALNVRLLSMLLRIQPHPAEPVELAREFIRNAGDGSIVADLVGTQPAGPMQKAMFDDPVWIADQFLNPHERLLDMEELLALVASSGYSIHRFLGFNEDAGKLLSPRLHERFRRLPAPRRLIALDLLLKPERYFVVLRKARRQISW